MCNWRPLLEILDCEFVVDEYLNRFSIVKASPLFYLFVFFFITYIFYHKFLNFSNSINSPPKIEQSVVLSMLLESILASSDFTN